MKKSVVILVVLSMVLAAGAAFAGGTKAFEFAKFNAANGNRYSVTYTESGDVRNIEATDAKLFSKTGSLKKSAIKIAYDFLTKNSDMLGVKVSDLKVEKNDRSGNINHVLFAHFVSGKRVKESTISVHVNNAGDVVMVNNGLVKIGSLSSINESISDEKAIEVAKNAVKCAATRSQISTDSIIYGRDGVAVNAIQVNIPSKNPLGDFVCVINAVDGSVISTEDIMNHADETPAPAPAPEPVVLGSLYVLNPLKCNITNEKLTNLTSNGKGLKGKWVNVVNEDTTAAVLGADGNYIFDPNDTHFDEVCAYYYINAVHDYFAKYGFTGLDRPIKVTVHYGTKYDNAFFSPMEGAIALGDGNKLNDLAKEESVSYHEYGHAVTNAMVYMPYSSESGAINEAFSDYVASTMTEDPMVGEWAVAKMNRPFIRNMDNKTHYPEDIQNEVHYDSNIYGGGLWDLRKALGAEKTDKIVHYSRNYLKGIKNQKFTDGVKALISADKEFCAGENAALIAKIFEARGIKIKSGDAQTAEALRFEAVNGNREAAKMLSDIENGNVK